MPRKKATAPRLTWTGPVTGQVIGGAEIILITGKAYDLPHGDKTVARLIARQLFIKKGF